MTPRWLTKAFPGRKGSAPNAAAPSRGVPSDPRKTPLPAGSSPSARTTGSSSPAVPPSACPAVRVVSSPASGTDALDLCMQVWSAAGAWARRPGGALWVMNPAWYRQIRAASESATGRRTDPDTWIPDAADVLFGIPVSVRDDGGEPHLEMADPPDALIDRAQGDPRDVAMALARIALAPPPLDRLRGDTMLAVAPVPGKILEEWRHVALGVWIAWPHAADAIHAEEMTAAQLRAILAARETGRLT
jgi:hypothetical protein